MDSRLEHRGVCLIRRATKEHGICHLYEFTSTVIVMMGIPKWHKHRMECNDRYGGLRAKPADNGMSHAHKSQR